MINSIFDLPIQSVFCFRPSAAQAPAVELPKPIDLPVNQPIDFKIAKREKEIQEWLQEEVGGETEVQTPYGNIDLLTHDSVIEIKRAENWKHALGQVLSYSYVYPGHRKAIVLFDANEILKFQAVADICALSDVEVWLAVGVRYYRLYRVTVSRSLNSAGKRGRTKKQKPNNERIEVSASEAFGSNSLYSNIGHSNILNKGGSRLLLPGSSGDR